MTEGKELASLMKKVFVNITKGLDKKKDNLMPHLSIPLTTRI